MQDALSAAQRRMLASSLDMTCGRSSVYMKAKNATTRTKSTARLTGVTDFEAGDDDDIAQSKVHCGELSTRFFSRHSQLNEGKAAELQGEPFDDPWVALLILYFIMRLYAALAIVHTHANAGYPLFAQRRLVPRSILSA